MRHPRCQCIKPNEKRCVNAATEIHHRKGRNEYYLAVVTWMSVCHQCHELIETRRDWARKRGYLLNRASAIKEAIPPLPTEDSLRESGEENES